MKVYNHPTLSNDIIEVFSNEYKKRFNSFCLLNNHRASTKLYRDMCNCYYDDALGNPEQDALEQLTLVYELRIKENR